MSRSWRIRVIGLSVVVTTCAGALVYVHYQRFPTTDDAYVDADVVGIVAQVAGPLTNLTVEDNQAVHAGDLLFEIDPRPFQIQLARARAQLDETGDDVSALADAVTSAEAYVRYSEAQLRLAEAQWRRVEPLAKLGALPFQDRDKAQAGLDEARAGLADSEAKLEQAQANLGADDENNPQLRAALAELESAELQLSYATVSAPVNGFVTDLTLSLGTYANVGSPMLSLVNTDTWRVTAYYKETQLQRIRIGQPAHVYLPAYPGVRFEGRVQGVGWGVEQQEGDGARGADGVPTVSPTVDWVRMAQRFPVRITLVNVDAAHPLRKGMRATARIDTTGHVANESTLGGR